MPGTVVVGTSRLTSNMLIKEMMDSGRRKEGREKRRGGERQIRTRG